MPRLTNKATGVVVNVDEATAARLGADWATEGESTKRKPGRPRKQPAANDE